MHLLNRIWLPSACSHLWKDKLMLVWTYSYSKKAERLYAPLEQSVAEKALLHWFGFCHLEPLLLISSEWDSSYLCFLGQLFTDFNLIQGLLDFAPIVSTSSQLIASFCCNTSCYAVKSWIIQELSLSECGVFISTCSLAWWCCLVTNSVAWWTSPHLCLVPTHKSHVFFPIRPLPLVNSCLYFILLIMNCSITKSDQRPAKNWSVHLIEWKPLHNFSKSHGRSICRFNIICNHKLALLA